MSAQHVLAATLVQPGKYELREYPMPEPASGCVLVKMLMSGICGTDKHTFQGYTTQYGDRRLEFDADMGKLQLTQSFFTDDMVLQGKLEL